MAGPETVETFAIVLSLAAATLVSEDAACIAAGVLVAEGRLGFFPATIACFVGITAGDLILFIAGRLLGRRVLGWRFPARWITPGALQAAADWLDRRGAVVVLASRFAPGTRLATYFAAGMLRTRARRFALWFTLAAAVWTPLVVGMSAFAGGQVSAGAIGASSGLLVRSLVALGCVMALMKVARWLARWQTRRRLVGLFRRIVRWEFWPPWVFYPPVVAYIGVLMLRHRAVTLFTAANPGMPGGGFIGESKFEILSRLSGAGAAIARSSLLPATLSPAERLRAVLQFMDAAALRFPIVLKPDQGQRGTGVRIVRSPDALAKDLSNAGDLIVQEYAPGHEFGVFYYRHPGSARGRIFSITEKRFPTVTGDGRRTLAELILADDRAVCQERVHRRAHARQLDLVLPKGETVQLVEIGSHCRGSLFLDASALVTPALEEAFDGIAKEFDGFYFGRFDVRTPSVADFTRGRSFTIVELNGVTSEATNIYDPGNSIVTAYRVLFRQWRIAFAIGAANRARGARTATVAELARMVLAYRKAAYERGRSGMAGSRRPRWIRLGHVRPGPAAALSRPPVDGDDAADRTSDARQRPRSLGGYSGWPLRAFVAALRAGRGAS